MGKRLVDLLAPLGVLVIVGAFAWQASGRRLRGSMETYVVVGAALMLAHLLLRWEDISRRLGRRQMLYGTNTAVLTLAVFGVLTLVNCPGIEGWSWSKGLVHRYSKRWDLTKGHRYSLSDQARKILSNLKEDVKITYFHKSAELALGKDRLQVFESASPRISVEYVDPNKSPGRARQSEVTRVPTVVVQRGERRENISGDSEQDIVNALIKVTRDAKKTVCFAEGEGERDIEDSGDTGYSAAKSALGKSQYETKKVFLAREGKVAEGCTVLVVAGPEKDLLPPTIESIRAYVKGGGRAILMVEPEIKEAYPNLDGLLKSWNLETAKDVVVDVNPMGQLFGTGALTPLAVQYPNHEITKDFRVMTAFHTARSVEAGKGTVPGVSVQNLLQTSQASWAETDLTLKEPVAMNEGKDRSGPVTLGAVATLRAEATPPSPPGEASPSASPEPSPKPREGRVVAFGDSDFASNGLLGFAGNRDFFLNTVAWLAEDPDLISIRPREPEDQRMLLTSGQMQGAFLASVVALPGLFLVLGAVSWWRRRG
jgi:ABC-type uncharacterized transport system involved in gliding motility auxiliary subunit